MKRRTAGEFERSSVINLASRDCGPLAWATPVTTAAVIESAARRGDTQLWQR